MGSLADLLQATSADIPDIVASDYPLGTYKGASVDGLDPLMLIALQAMLSGKPTDELVDLYQPVAEASEEGPWLVRIPPELLRILADIAPHDVETFAEKWVQTDQLRDSGWTVEDLAFFLEPLILYAQSIGGSGKELFLWTYG
ncbi:MAG: hypothetical protein P1P76_10885 [Anaerolineales bacterium]|nr:hypothetical protein [Anaerolineales bacterium]